MLHDLIVLWFGWVEQMGYLGVFLLMAMESSILPVPSEVVIPPAAYFAAQGKMDLLGVIVAGTAGSYVGAIVMYAASRYLGRPLMLRFGKYIFVPPEKLERAERFLARYEAGGIFFARLLPVVRHLIGIPAGIVRMRVGVYSAMTVLGSALWCAVLAFFGQAVLGDNPELIRDPNALLETLKAKSHLIGAGVLVLAALYIGVMWVTRPRSATGKTAREGA